MPQENPKIMEPIKALKIESLESKNFIKDL